MSVQELKFQIGINNIIIKTLENKDLAIAINGRMICLDRNQAHLLMLYLQEHLAPQPVSRQCNCGNMHPKAYVCTMLKK